jgi:hypothetical protein
VVIIFSRTDPDPIWYCQELHACPKVNSFSYYLVKINNKQVSGGSVTMTSCTVTPTSGAIGTTFKVVALYTVNNATGPGLQAVTLTPPEGEPAGKYLTPTSFTLF